MTTSTGSTPKFMLEELNALSAEGLGIHSVVDIEASASGEILRAETVVQPGGGGGPLHRHRFQEERFAILEGEIIGRIGGSRLRVRAGETFVVPPDAPHTFSVEADQPARFITEFRPGLRLAEFFAQLFWLADHGHVDAKGRIHPLQAAVLARVPARVLLFANDPGSAPAGDRAAAGRARSPARLHRRSRRPGRASRERRRAGERERGPW
jgi:quercetin dioxygenase-like cupin family protein